MKATSTLTFVDDDGHIREVQTIVNDDYTINAFYSNEVARVTRLRNQNESLRLKLKEAEKKKKATGLGDWVKNTIDKLTYNQVKPCNSCKKRQEILNRIKLKENSSGE
jgi:hypothetical protein